MEALVKMLGFAIAGVVVALFVGMAVLFFVSRVLVNMGKKTDVTHKADAIFVPGARIGGRALNLRLDMAFKLYQQGYAPAIVVSGGQGSDEPTTEAVFMAAYLVKRGVPSEHVLLEEDSYSTDENFRKSKPIMDAHGIEDMIIVTNDYHCYRCGKIADNYAIKHQTKPVPKPKGIYIKGPFRETLAVMWGYLIGQLNSK